jgi:hypothetical protein
MRIIAVKSNAIGSRFIRWGIGEDASHLAIAFNDNTFLHSYLNGVELLTLPEFEKHKYIETDSVLLTVSDEKLFKEKMIRKLVKADYDYGAFIYFGYRAALKKLFRVKMPQTGFDDRDRFICTEVIYALAETYSELTKDFALFWSGSLSITTPLGAVQYLKGVIKNGKVINPYDPIS